MLRSGPLPPLIRIGFAENRVQGSYNWHLELSQQMQNVAARRPAKYPILVLQAYQIKIREVQEGSYLFVRGHVILFQRYPHTGGVVVPTLRVIDRHSKQLGCSTFHGNRITQVGGKGCNSALPRKIVADNGDPARKARSRSNVSAGYLLRGHGDAWIKLECLGGWTVCNLGHQFPYLWELV